MRCTRCNFFNPEGMKFCGNCGESLQLACPSCSFINPPDFKFCGNCGYPLNPTEAEVSAQPMQPALNPTNEGERRHLTVMFCDLVDSTSLAEKVDPEDLRTIVTKYQHICSKVIARFEGYIAQYLGDGILVYFGYPTTYENSAHQAVSSGLGILEAISCFNQSLEQVDDMHISVRIGIHTGNVVIGSIGSGESNQPLALGATPNIAARLQSLAQPGTLLISADTYQLVYRFFSFDPLGPHAVKGLSYPLELFRVVRENTARSRFEARKEDWKKIPIVGRNKEVKQLAKIWKKSKQGKSHFVLLSGEAGMGKSRILQELMSQVAAETDAWLINLHCSPYHKNTPYHPFMQGIKHLALRLRGNESPHEQVERLEGYLIQNGLIVDEVLPLLATLMAIPFDRSRYSSIPFSPEQQKLKINEALITLFLHRASEQNLLLILEDLHWIDTASLGLISQLIHQAPNLTFLCILSFRPEFTPPWRQQPQIIHFPLQNLSEDACREIIRTLTKDKQFPKELTQQIIQKTDGVPLFVEELTKMVLNSDLIQEFPSHYALQQSVDALEIPSTLHDSLIARLDRMAHTKKIAQLGATIGREFDYSLLQAVADTDENALQTYLNQLVEAELLTQSGQLPAATYRFRHALICDAAYGSLLKSQRHLYHKRIAKALLVKFPELAEQRPERVAYHYHKAEVNHKAATFYIKAAEKAVQHLSYEEALNYLERGEEQLKAMAAEPSAIDLEINLLRIKIPILVMVRGWSSPDSCHASDRLRILCEQVDDKSNLCRALNGLTTYYIWSGYPFKAATFASKALSIARELNATDLLLDAYRLKGQSSVYTGKLKESLTYFNKAIALYELAKSDGLEVKIAEHPIIFNFMHSCHVLWCLGYPEQARERAHKALQLADSLHQPYSLAVCYFINAIFSFLTGKQVDCITYAEKSLSLGEKYGLQQFSNEVKTYLGCALVLKGDLKAGRKIVEQSLQWREKHNLVTGMHIHLHPQVLMYQFIGEYSQGLAAVNRVLKLTETFADQYGISETYRMKGELLWAAYKEARAQEALDALDKSMLLATKQQARSFELRTAISIVKIWCTQGRTAEAYLLLSNIYSRFTEGLETQDLKIARQLIDTLTPTTISAN